MKKIRNTVFLLTLVLTVFAFRHPYHVNVIEIRVSNTGWQMTVRVFTHEWEGVLPKGENEKIDLKNMADSIRNTTLLREYLANHLIVKGDTTNLNWTWVGYENKQDETWCYYESKAAWGKSVSVYSAILYEHGHEQQTIVHLYVNGKRFSRRITAPEKELVLTVN